MNYNDFFENKEIPVISNFEGFEKVMKQLDSYKLIHINRIYNKNEYYGYEPFLSSIYLIKNCKQVGEYKKLSPEELKNFYQNIISNKDEQLFESLPVNRDSTIHHYVEYLPEKTARDLLINALIKLDNLIKEK